MLVKLQQQTLSKVKNVESRIEKVENLVVSSTAELKQLIEEIAEKSLDFKTCQYEVALIYLCSLYSSM